MLNPQIKYAFKFIFVVIVIAGLIASYLFTGVSSQPQPAANQQTTGNFDFVGPTDEPAVTGPTTSPAANGPSAPPTR